MSGTDVDCTIVVLENISSSKVKGIKRTNATLKFHGTDCIQTELFAKNYAKVYHLIARESMPYFTAKAAARCMFINEINIEILDSL